MTRVLLLEDEPLISMLVQDLLEELGYEVVGPAATTSSALALIGQRLPDAAILDVSLKGETSYLVADVLADFNVPFIFATGHNTHVAGERHAGAPVLVKPYDLKALSVAMRHLGLSRQ